MSIPDPVFSWNLSKHYVYRQDLKHDLCEFKQVYHLELAQSCVTKFYKHVLIACDL